MTSLSASPTLLTVGDLAPDCLLPDGSRLQDWRGQPLILAFAPDEWNPSHALESQIYAELSEQFGGAFVDASTDSWHALPSGSDLARQWDVNGRRALFVLDEAGVVAWMVVLEPGESVQTGEVLAALELLTSKPPAQGGLSRRGFLSVSLAAAAVLTLGASAEARGRTMLPLDQVRGQQAKMRPASFDRSGTIPVRLKINGRVQQLQIEPRVALLDALREYLGLTGTKKGCDHGQCGACTVHIDGERALSCLTLAVMNEGREITTIEGLARGDVLHPMQQAFIEHDAFQCGYCTPGQIMSAVALLKEGRARTDAEVREAMSGNLCRCAAYPNIIAAIQDARGV